MKQCLFLLLASWLLVSCEKEHRGDCFKSTGEVTREKRVLSGFSNVQIDRRLDVVLIPDTVEYAEVEAGENLLEGIRTTVENGWIYLENRNRCNWVRSYKIPVTVYLHVKELAHILLYGSGRLSNTGVLRGDSMLVEFRDASGDVMLNVELEMFQTVQHTGASDITVSGTAGRLMIYTASLGYGDYSQLQSGYVYVHSKSSADCRVYGTSLFDFNHEGDGTIFYRGPGTVNGQTISGRGRVMRVD